MPTTHPCPKCNQPTTDEHWLLIAGKIELGACETCWSTSYQAWWDRLVASWERDLKERAELETQLAQGVQIV